MVAVDSRGADGHPRFLGTGAPATADDLTTLGEEMYQRGTRLIGTTAERLAYPYPMEGLRWRDTTDDSEYELVSEQWRLVYNYASDTYGWQALSTAAAYPWVGHGASPQIRCDNRWVRIRGRLKRSDDSSFGTSSAGYGLFTLPEAFRPPATLRFTASTTGAAGSIPYAHIEVNAGSGEARLWANGNTPWIGFDQGWSLDA